MSRAKLEVSSPDRGAHSLASKTKGGKHKGEVIRTGQKVHHNDAKYVRCTGTFLSEAVLFRRCTYYFLY